MLIRVDSLSQTDFDKAYERAASFWGRETDTRESTPLTQLHERFAEPPTDATYHHVPTSFSLDDDLSFMPIDWEMRWIALERNIAHFKPRAAVSALPFSHEADPVFIATLGKTRTIGTSVLTSNVPLAQEMIRKLGAELVVATYSTAGALLGNLDSLASLPVTVWHMVVRPEEATEKRRLPGLFYKDIHILPGHSIAWQCPYISSEEFHPSPSYVWHQEDGSLLVTSLDDVPAPLLRTRALNGSIREEMCECGARHVISIV